MTRAWGIERHTGWGLVLRGPYTWLGARIRRTGPHERVVRYFSYIPKARWA